MDISHASNLSLETERLTLRPIVYADLKPVYQIHSQAQVNRYIPYSTWENQQDALDWYDYVETRRENRIAEHWGILETSSGQLIGHCLAFNYKADPTQVEIGYVLNPHYEGQGFMYEAMLGFIHRLSQLLEVEQVNALVEIENLGSIKLLKRLNFTEGECPEDEAESGLLCFTSSGFTSSGFTSSGFTSSGFTSSPAPLVYLPE